MNILLILGIGMAGGLGSGLRYLTDTLISRRLRDRFPWGTFMVNAIGSLTVGLIVGLASSVISEAWTTILGTGLLGGYTTFSTTSLETVQLLRKKRYLAAAMNSIGSLLLCVACAGAGLALSSNW